MTVNKDLDQQIIAVQKEMSGDKKIAESEKYQQINGKISSILDNEIKKIQAKRPNFWVPLIILLIIIVNIIRFIACIVMLIIRSNYGIVFENSKRRSSF